MATLYAGNRMRTRHASGTLASAPVPAEGFGAALRRLRERAGLTQEDLAERAGLSPRAIRALEGGERLHPYPHTVRALAAALDLDKHEAAGLQASISQRGADAGDMDAAAATRTLPRDVPSFTGRTDEMASLIATLSRVAHGGDTVAIAAVDGMGGVGKTAFAIHAAHRLAQDFPDGQLFVDLRAHAAGQRPVAPADALATLLLSLGVPARRMPRSVDDRSALWRDRVAGKRMLVVLDDATGSEQVRPLLPSAAGCLTLVTSRRRLAALEDVLALTLGTLPVEDASQLLARLIGARAVQNESSAATDLIELCGFLPLAIRIVAGRLRSHPTWTLRALGNTLRSAQDRLAEIRAENLAIEATFDLSYRDLAEDQQRLFRRLGLHPGQDIDVYAAAALDGGTLEDTGRGLESLYNDHLLDEPAPGRYRLHDLVRDYARRLAQHDEAASIEVSLDRLLDYYVSATTSADQHLVRSSYGSRPRVERIPDRSPDLTSRQSALMWLNAERGSLCACVQYAATHSRERRAGQLAHAMRAYLQSSGQWDQLLANNQVAVAAARRARDHGELAVALTDLGCVQRLIGDSPGARDSLTEALALFREMSDRHGEARALTELGVTERNSSANGGNVVALQCFSAALDLFREVDDQLGQADTLRVLGMTLQEGSNYTNSRTYLEQAVTLFRDLGDRGGQADVLSVFGRVQYWMGEYRAAAATLAECFAMFCDVGNSLGQANALNDLGRVQCQLGELSAAAASHFRALGLYRELGSRLGEANALAYVVVVQRMSGDIRSANASARASLSIARDLVDDMGVANVLTELAFLQQLEGDYAAARASLDEALALVRALGDRVGEAEALNCLGGILLDVADDGAIVNFRKALDLARDICCPLEEARALEGIGLSLSRTPGPPEGIPELRQALAIYERIESPDRRRVKATLRKASGRFK